MNYHQASRFFETSPHPTFLRAMREFTMADAVEHPTMYWKKIQHCSEYDVDRLFEDRTGWNKFGPEGSVRAWAAWQYSMEPGFECYFTCSPMIAYKLQLLALRSAGTVWKRASSEVADYEMYLVRADPYTIPNGCCVLNLTLTFSDEQPKQVAVEINTMVGRLLSTVVVPATTTWCILDETIKRHASNNVNFEGIHPGQIKLVYKDKLVTARNLRLRIGEMLDADHAAWDPLPPLFLQTSRRLADEKGKWKDKSCKQPNLPIAFVQQASFKKPGSSMVIKQNLK